MIEENYRKIFSIWSQLFTGLALNSSHIQMNYQTILAGNQLSYHFTGHSSHHGWPSESRRIVGSLHSIRPSGPDLSTGLANRFNWSLPGWNLAEIYGIDMLRRCGIWFDSIWFYKKHIFFSFLKLALRPWPSWQDWPIVWIVVWKHMWRNFGLSCIL